MKNENLSPEEKNQIKADRKRRSFKWPFHGKNRAQRLYLHHAFFAINSPSSRF